MTPVLSDKQVKECADKFRTFIENNKGKILHEESWGLRKLAYSIQKKSHGFYHLIESEIGGDVISKLEIEFKRDERILRFLSVKMDKYAIEFAESRRKKKIQEVVKENDKNIEPINKKG